jgi:hypothetical protein
MRLTPCLFSVPKARAKLSNLGAPALYLLILKHKLQIKKVFMAMDRVQSYQHFKGVIYRNPLEG